ncbi:hypothetical protein BDK51DRAFT_47324 [Blyttiomyces helicus]|uniref:Uncharacterized protein n=1 Tax=Blyttiomyces helicus TaxID=388810 RepID=A0A4P9W745_9FUNG|nr:hypothetical protein BDK51DRAFT_47324 [Blyttiomyces helicus]|eukprot:RKO87213.1 hypothetical protein BDK51DRAFT_47324 [Blyttiomyces helicus]
MSTVPLPAQAECTDRALVSGPSSLGFASGSAIPADGVSLKDIYQGLEIFPYRNLVASIVLAHIGYPFTLLMSTPPLALLSELPCTVMGEHILRQDAQLLCNAESSLSSSDPPCRQSALLLLVSSSAWLPIWCFASMDLNIYKWNSPVGNSSIGALFDNSLVAIGDHLYVFGSSASKQSIITNALWQIPIDSLTTATNITSSGTPAPCSNDSAANLGTDRMLVYGGTGAPQPGNSRFPPTSAGLQNTFAFYGM